MFFLFTREFTCNPGDKKSWKKVEIKNSIWNEQKLRDNCYLNGLQQNGKLNNLKCPKQKIKSTTPK